jgi:hypothetical protein
MIATLVKMIITGSYHSFVDKNHGQPNESSSSGMLKVKLATSIMGVSSIHLLQSFISAECVDWDVIYKQLIIHCAFIIGCLALAYVDYLHCKSEVINNYGRKIIVPCEHCGKTLDLNQEDTCNYCGLSCFLEPLVDVINML